MVLRYGYIMSFYLSLVVLFSCINHLLASKTAGKAIRDYCIIGAGPSRLQMGYFLQKSNRDYVIFERTDASGSFFRHYPRHRKLISLNKIYTGKTNKEFNLRHDWNSLLSHDESLQMRYYSKELFPSADDYVQYLNDFATKLLLNTQYNTDANQSNESQLFSFEDQWGTTYSCRTLIICTGIATKNSPWFVGIEHTESYEDISLDTEEYEGKNVLILGAGNFAFETADYIAGVANFIHVLGRSKVRLAWDTHYVGDLRAVSNGIFDTYLLKCLAGVIAGLEDVSNFLVIKRTDGKLLLGFPEDIEKLKARIRANNWSHNFSVSSWFGFNDTSSKTTDYIGARFDNFPMRDPYDKIIRCLKFDYGIFNSEFALGVYMIKEHQYYKTSKYPPIKANYESASVPGLFFAGTNTHSIDYKKSAGGFIHGFRYTARALHRILEFRNHRVQWPFIRLPISELLNHIMKRINEASGTYQMFGVLGDIALLSEDGTEYIYIEEYPLKMLHEIPTITGLDSNQMLVISFEYGNGVSDYNVSWSDESADILKPQNAHLSFFLHPVLYFYDSPPSENDMNTANSDEGLSMPEPSKIHHMVEDFLTDFTAPISHVLVLRRFLESCTNQDLRYFFDDECFFMSLTHNKPPLSCQNYYLKGQRLSVFPELRVEQGRVQKSS